jgi:hypothetical protein
VKLEVPEIKKDELIEKVRNCIKDIGYDQEGFTLERSNKNRKPSSFAIC